MRTHTLSLPTMLAYGFGQFAEAVKNQGFNVFLLFYYNQVLGVSATGTSIALAIALIFDAITDPLAGILSDKFRSRWGRRHPFIAIAALPLALFFYLLFNPPAGLGELGNIAWLLTFAILVRAAMTFYHVPHLALGAEMAPDYHQRSTLYSFNTFFSLTGGAVFIPLSYFLFFPTTPTYNPALLNQAAYGPWAIFAGLLMIFAIAVCCLGTAREIPRLREMSLTPATNKFSLLQLFSEVREALDNRSFRSIFFGLILSTFILAVEGVFNPFMGFHFWGMTTEQLKFLPFGSLLGLSLAVIAIPAITRRLDKKISLIGSALLVIININLPIVLALLAVPWFPERGSSLLLYLLIASSGITAFLGLILFAMVNSMFADISDEHELDTGERREGVIFAARAFALKVSSSMGLIFGGMLLDLIAFPRGAALGSVAEDTVWQLGFIAGPATSFFTFFGMYFYMGYRINKARHDEILESLAKLKKDLPPIEYH